MKIETVRFGQIDIDENKVITFTDGLPGLEDYHKFAFIHVGESYPILWLQSIEDKAICLPVIDSFQIMPDYAFDIGDEDVSDLKLSGNENMQVLSVLVIPESIDAMTVNLAAPIVVNTDSGFARQIILSSEKYAVRVPVFNEIIKLVKEVDADAGAVEKA